MSCCAESTDDSEEAVELFSSGEREERAGNLVEASGWYTKCVDASSSASSWGSSSVKSMIALAQLRLNGARHPDDLLQAEKLYRRAIDAPREPDLLSDLALEKLLILLVQEDSLCAAAALLSSAGYRYRLSSNVLRYPFPLSEEAAALQRSLARSGRRFPDHRPLVRAADGALPLDMLASLQQLFGPLSLFWSSHRYSASVLSPSPYFSFAHSLIQSPSSPSPSSSSSSSSSPLIGDASFMDSVIRRVRDLIIPLFPAVAEATCAEWWAHCRPHHSGHQMHFDSDDEGRDGVRNPIVSTVLYLTEGVGGPTLVTDQRIGASSLATCGWFVFPKTNRLTVFDGTYLHGVVPGRGVPPDPDKRRVTLMIAFWKTLQRRSYPEGIFGASMNPYLLGSPLPYAPATSPREVDAILVAPIWSPVVDGPKVPLFRMPSYDECFQGF